MGVCSYLTFVRTIISALTELLLIYVVFVVVNYTPCLITSSPQTMLFHEALHLVFTTFSRQVLQQGRLTAYLADCAVFDTFDDKRTICLTIDRHYGSRLYTCLSHSPYKANFDAIMQEVKLRHSNIDPQIVDYVFQSIRYAWGKIKSVRPPKPPVLFAPVKKKKLPRRKNNSTQLYINLPNPTPRTKRSRRPSPKRRQSPIANHQSPKKRLSPIANSQSPIANRPSPIANSPSPKKRPTLKLTPAQRAKRSARVVMYLLSLVFSFCACITLNAQKLVLGIVFLMLLAVCVYVLYRLK